MRACQECSETYDQSLESCPHCGKLSVDQDNVDDRLIEQASLRNLGDLIRNAQSKGLIKPQVVGSGGQ